MNDRKFLAVVTLSVNSTGLLLSALTNSLTFAVALGFLLIAIIELFKKDLEL